MMTFEMFCLNLPEVTSAEIKIWIENQWLRPQEKDGNYLFQEIDEARVHLIIELRDDLGITEDAMSVVLNLLDQLYTTRRQMKYLCEVIATDHYPDTQQKLRHMMTQQVIVDL
ncbi:MULTISPECIES: chaperone modulator CbpM [Commensalibacter]|uniref:MerR family transcriptional regulator n=2 Tax=Commensalibacter TaxID=1079922 RepID=W7DUD8_9PROT|nr:MULTISPECIES: chaperone modulator CbpM [Commensalibacter]EUK17883.1 hypothetical protein COMX_07810 [Commensalibacter papalotli (ex Servin-Garciduenas et al. 2014)]CAI3942461.1 unnamed protein product [Commensalibacter papalotli (ex Botero et al. 2024)]CAI3948517.1 unnamed protein product [Commensalibacter papalotli (ex Botero et al. 2024)]